LPYPIPLPPTHSLRPNATPPTSLYTLSLHDALPVAHKHRVGPLGFLANHIHLLLRALRGVHVFDADLLGQVGHFGLAVARYQQHAVKLVFGPQVVDEAGAVSPWLIAEAVGGDVLAIDEDHALKPSGLRRQLLHHLRLRAGQQLAAGYLDRAAIDHTPQARTRRLGNLAGRLQ